MLQTLRPAEGRFEAHPEQEGADLDEEQKTSQPTGAKTSTDIAIELNAGVSPASLQEFLVDLAKQHLAAPAAAGPVDSVRSRRGRQRELHSSSPPPQPRAPQPSNTSVKRKALSSSSSGRGAQLGAMASMEQGATLTSRKRLKLGVQRRRVTTDGEGEHQISFRPLSFHTQPVYQFACRYCHQLLPHSLATGAISLATAMRRARHQLNHTVEVECVGFCSHIAADPMRAVLCRCWQGGCAQPHACSASGGSTGRATCLCRHQSCRRLPQEAAQR